MKILAVSGQKGGVGKTTLAVHLAGYWARKGIRISLIDRDPQAAASKWARGEPGLPFQVHDDLGAPLRSAVATRKAAGDELVLIDTAPSVGGAFRDLPGLADFILLPARPSILDFRALAESVAALDGADVKMAAILTQVAKRQTITKQAQEGLAQLEIPVFKSRMHARAAYQTAALQNRTVFELGESGETAAADIAAIAAEIAPLLGLKSKKQ